MKVQEMKIIAFLCGCFVGIWALPASGQTMPCFGINRAKIGTKDSACRGIERIEFSSFNGATKLVSLFQADEDQDDAVEEEVLPPTIVVDDGVNGPVTVDTSCMVAIEVGDVFGPYTVTDLEEDFDDDVDEHGNELEVRGSFSPAVPIDFAVDVVSVSINDGAGHNTEFSIPAGSFQVDGDKDDREFEFAGEVSGAQVKAKFETCKFKFTAKGVTGAAQLVGTRITVRLGIGANIGQSTILMVDKRNHLKFTRVFKVDCCPECEGIASMQVTSGAGVLSFDPPIGEDKLPKETVVDDGVNGAVTIDTSCDQPFEVGDVFSSYTISALAKLYKEADVLPPTGSWGTPIEGEYLNTSTIQVLLHLADDVSGLDPLSLDILLDGNSIVHQFPAIQSGLQATLVADLVVTEEPHVLVASFRDLAGNLGTASVSFTVLPPIPPAATLDNHTTATRSSSVTITGSALGGSQVEVSGPAGIFLVPVANNVFSADVSLVQNTINHVFFTVIDTFEKRSPPVSVAITQDMQPPNLFLDFPADGSEVTTATADVGGRVGDVLSGFLGMTVVVNGIPAVVDAGIGNNGTFIAPLVPLSIGSNILSATATDDLGNSRTTQITITRIEIPPGTPRMEVTSGNRQTGQVGTVLAVPLIIKVMRGDGTPFAGKVITFDVERSNGRLTEDGTGDGRMMLQIRADANGVARSYLRLGSDAGCGNNRVSVTSLDIAGTVLFCESATPGPAAQINVGSGNNQRAELGAPITEPLRVWVSDACNGIEGVDVTFTVVRGDGKIDGLDTAIATTSRTGHAEVPFMLVSTAGNNVIRADFPGNQTQPAEFVVFGIARQDDAPTNFSGLVLDNASQPIEGATCSLTVGAAAPLVTTSGAGGQFRFDGLVGSGPAHLRVDATTALPIGGFPALAFAAVIIPNADNSLSTPVLIPSLNPKNVRFYSTTTDTELTVDEIDGLKMIVKAGSMRLTDGTTAPDGTPIFLNQVHHDDVPMPMPDGAAPPFAWTLQPSGATFDPPVQLIYPNMSGLPAGSIAYFLSFNHDAERFEIVASGQVTEDALSIVSDPGAGIVTAGWGCNCPPYSVTGNCCNTGPEACSFCDGEPQALNTDGISTANEGMGSCDDRNLCTDNDTCDPDAESGCRGELIGTPCSEITFRDCPAELVEGDICLVEQNITGQPGDSGDNEAWVDNLFLPDLAVCIDEKSKQWSIRAGFQSLKVKYAAHAPRVTPNPVPGGNVGPCPDSDKTKPPYCYCDMIADMQDYSGNPGTGEGKFFTIKATRAHERFHATTDFPKRLKPFVEKFRQTLATFHKPCFLDEARAAALLERMAKREWNEHVSQSYTLSAIPAFRKQHNFTPFDDGAYVAGQEVLDKLIEKIELFAVPEWGACPTAQADELISASTPRTLEELIVSAPTTTLSAGDSVNLQVTGNYSDGTSEDLTASQGTSYAVGNDNSLAVDSGGHVDALASGEDGVRVLNFDETSGGLPATSYISIAVLFPNDLDNDLIPDDLELLNGMDPNDPNDGQLDNDVDGLNNFDEFNFGTELENPDTDADGSNDGDEVELGSDPLLAPMPDETWSFSVGGQTIQAESLGSFRIGNIFAADQFGTTGPGSPPDFLSDDFLRIEGFWAANGQSRWASGEPFQIRGGETFRVGDLTIHDTPPPFPESLNLSVCAACTAVVAIGDTVQLITTGILADGSQQDVTLRNAWTTYRTSNPAIATVSGDGLVTALSRGSVFITAVNEGTTAVKRVDITEVMTQTTLEGFVQFEDGQPVVGASVSMQPSGGSGVSGPDGFFSFGITVLADESMRIKIRASSTIGEQNFVGFRANLTPIHDGITDAGILTLRPSTPGPLFSNLRLPVGNAPVSITTADFDGDGDADFAVANFNSHNVSILLNNDDGTFAPSRNVAVGSSPISLISSDLDGDGDVDLAVANLSGRNIFIMINDGNGSFVVAHITNIGFRPTSIVAADLDGDGVADLAVAGEATNGISVLLNNGEGFFDLAVNYESGTFPNAITAADFDKDGDIDLAVSGATLREGGSVSVLLNNGSGTFAAPGNFESHASKFISTADFDGDGDADLVATNRNANNVSVLLNNGDGSFAAQVTFAAGISPAFVTVVDFDSDGDVDIATSNTLSDEVSILLNNGDGVFAAPVQFEAGGGAGVFTTADLDGDGIADLAVADPRSDKVTILLNNGDGWAPASLAFETGVAPFATSATDLDGDGDVDLAVANFQGNDVSILLNSGDGTFTAATRIGVGSGSTGVTAADFDADGDEDLAIANQLDNNVSILLNNGDGTFGGSVNIATGQAPGVPVGADFDADGKIDLAVTNMEDGNISVFLGKGDGTFEPPMNFVVGGNPFGLTVVDLDADGDKDLAVAKGDGFISTVLNNGDATFAVAVDYPVGAGSVFVTSADYNGDGFVDLASLNLTDSNVSILLNSGDGVMNAAVNYPLDSSHVSIASADFDADGDVDLALADFDGGSVTLLLNNGDGTFAPPLQFGAGSSDGFVTTADFDGDGDEDLAVTSSSQNSIRIMLNRTVQSSP